MSEGHEQYAEFTERVVKYLNDRLIELRAKGWSEGELAEIETNLERIKQGSLDSFLPTPEQWEMIEFVQRMMTRQGTTMPDFKALYKKKAEIDRRLLGGELP